MDEKLKTSGITLDSEEQYQIRESIVRLSKMGKSNKDIAEVLNVSERHVRNTKKNYAEQGELGIKPKTRGRKKGEQRKLTAIQEQEIKELITDKYPEQLNLHGYMWTRANIKELILRKYKIDMPSSTLGYYLQHWDFSARQPKKQTYVKDATTADEWFNGVYPGITERAKIENAEFFIGDEIDEIDVRNTSHCTKLYNTLEQVPKSSTKIKMLYAISRRGKLRFILHKNSINPDKIIDFYSRLVRDTNKKVFLIIDSLRMYDCEIIHAWLEKTKTELKPFTYRSAGLKTTLSNFKTQAQ